MSGVYWEVGRECKYSGPEGYRWHKGALGLPRGVGVSGAVRGV